MELVLVAAKLVQLHGCTMRNWRRGCYWKLLYAKGGFEKAGSQVAGEPVCEGILVAAFGRVSAVLQRTSVVP